MNTRRIAILLLLLSFVPATGQDDADPDAPLTVLDLPSRDLEPALAAELVDVARLRDASTRRTRGAALAQAADEEVELEPGVHEEREPERDDALQPRAEEPHDEQDDRRDSKAPYEGRFHRDNVPPPWIPVGWRRPRRSRRCPRTSGARTSTRWRPRSGPDDRRQIGRAHV